MKKTLILALAVLSIGSAAQAQPRTIERIHTYMDFRTVVGEVIFYCDGGEPTTTGFLTGEYVETIYECP